MMLNKQKQNQNTLYEKPFKKIFNTTTFVIAGVVAFLAALLFLTTGKQSSSVAPQVPSLSQSNNDGVVSEQVAELKAQIVALVQKNENNEAEKAKLEEELKQLKAENSDLVVVEKHLVALQDDNKKIASDMIDIFNRLLASFDNDREALNKYLDEAPDKREKMNSLLGELLQSKAKDSEQQKPLNKQIDDFTNELNSDAKKAFKISIERIKDTCEGITKAEKLRDRDGIIKTKLSEQRLPVVDISSSNKANETMASNKSKGTILKEVVTGAASTIVLAISHRLANKTSNRDARDTVVTAAKNSAKITEAVKDLQDLLDAQAAVAKATDQTAAARRAAVKTAKAAVKAASTETALNQLKTMNKEKRSQYWAVTKAVLPVHAKQISSDVVFAIARTAIIGALRFVINKAVDGNTNRVESKEAIIESKEAIENVEQTKELEGKPSVEHALSGQSMPESDQTIKS